MIGSADPPANDHSGCETLLRLMLETAGVSEILLTRSIPGRAPHETYRMVPRRRAKRGRSRRHTFQQEVSFPSARTIALIVEALEEDGGPRDGIAVLAEEALHNLEAMDALLTARAITGFKAARGGFDSDLSLLLDGLGRPMVTDEASPARLAPFGLRPDGQGRVTAIWEGGRDPLEAALHWNLAPEGAVQLIHDGGGPVASCRTLPIGGESGTSPFDTRVATLMHLKTLAR